MSAFGKIPEVSDSLNILAKMFEIMGAISFKTLGGMLFGPTALVVSIEFIISFTSWALVGVKANLCGLG